MTQEKSFWERMFVLGVSSVGAYQAAQFADDALKARRLAFPNLSPGRATWTESDQKKTDEASLKIMNRTPLFVSTRKKTTK